MKKKLRAQLDEALQKGTMVRLYRKMEELEKVDGYIVALGVQFALVLVVGDHIWFDGFQALRLEDLHRVALPNPRREFFEKALSLRGEQKPATPAVNLDNIQALLTSASAAFPLITVHSELTDAGACYIGKVVSVDKKQLVLKDIDLDARFSEDDYECDVKDITRVDFGGDYEDALYIVAASRGEI